MSEFGYYNPVRILAGEGCVKTFDGFSAWGKRGIIVCGRNSARISGALDDVKALLDKNNISYTIFDRVETNPSVETCYAAGAEAREYQADFVLGIGGGSPLDAAKAIAVYAANPHLEAEDIFRLDFREPPLPVYAIGTTAGTGSEVTQYSVLTVRSIENKKSVSHPALFPKIAFLDPNYTNTLPYSVTVSTAIDALCHGIEGYFSKRANDITEALAERAIQIMGTGLKELVGGTLDSRIRAKLLYGSTLAGMVIAGTGTGFVHAMGYPLTYFDGVPHGEANAYFIADFVEYMSLSRPDKERKVYRLMGFSDLSEFRELISKAIPLDLTLNREKVLKYSHIASKSKGIQNSVFEIAEPDIYDLYKQYSK